MDIRSTPLARSADLAWSRAVARLARLGQAVPRALTPRLSWVTFALLFLTLFTVDGSVEAAEWVPTPSLAAVTFWGMVTAALLAQRRAHPLLLHAAGLLVGIGVVLRFTMTLVEAPEGRTTLEEMFQRLGLWLDAAFGGGISSDTLAFGLVLVAICWVISYLSAWFVFRMGSAWGGILPGALGLLTNLGYLPDRFFLFFFVYIVLAILLVVWMSSLSREQGWRSRGVATNSWEINLLSLTNALWLGVVVVLLAALLPMRAVMAEPLRQGYERVRYPVEVVQEHFARLFSGLSGRKAMAIRTYGATLPFQGSISLGEVTVFTARSRYPTYWTARVYTTYTSQGWLVPQPAEWPWGWEPRHAQPQEYQSRMDVEQDVELNFGTSTVLMGGLPMTLSREAALVVPQAPAYTVDLHDPAGYELLPPDLRQWAKELREAWLANQGEEKQREAWQTDQRERGKVGQALTPLFLEHFPQETVLVEAEVETAEDLRKRLLFQKDEEASLREAPVLGSIERLLRTEGRLASVSVTRTQPVPPDLVALRATHRMAPDTTYSLQSSISVATEEELERAGTDYPKWVTDRYLQLPDTLPDRVRQLALRTTEGAQTPYDKALLVMNLLRGYEYSLRIERPPYDGDGVDHFLFDQQRGYSDYFASAMTVLMRAAGVPSRMVAGYGAGTWDPSREAFVVRDKDSHAWTEVFFPGYGWVIFEPTPTRTPPERGVPSPPGAEEKPSKPLEFEQFYGDEEEFGPDFIAEVEPGAGAGEATANASAGKRSIAVVGLLAGLLAGVATVWYVIWQRGMGALGSPGRAYEGMRRLAGLAHLAPQSHQTPYEFGRDLEERLPSVRRQVNLICNAYVRTTYGRQQLPVQEQGLLDEAWRRVRGRLVRRILHLSRG